MPASNVSVLLGRMEPWQRLVLRRRVLRLSVVCGDTASVDAISRCDDPVLEPFVW